MKLYSILENMADGGYEEEQIFNLENYIHMKAENYDNEYLTMFNISTFPYTIIVNSEGIIVYKGES